jgi:vanillate O-demethylase monooxygenase subunit
VSELDHWHPVLEARALGRRPVAIKLCGREVVAFRAGDGTLGALEDRCVHRRMRLSEGRVEDCRLVCPYHGWSYACDGAAESPATPKLHAQVLAWDVSAWHGAIWLRARGARADFPRFDADGYRFTGTMARLVKAPIELVLDNFIEVEHTPEVHSLLGYDPGRVAEVEIKVETADGEVRVLNAGPQKRLSWFIRSSFGIGARDSFHDDWTTRFSPVYTVYDQWWSKPDGGARPDRLKFYVFFNPIDAGTTQIFVFSFVQFRSWRRLAYLFLERLLNFLVAREMQLDCQMVEKIADKTVSLEGMKLSRFDKPLAEARRRLERIYRGHPAG